MRAATLSVALLAVLALAGCSDEPQDDPSTATSTADPSDVAALGWSPCDGVSAPQVSRFAGQRMTEQNGTADQPRCTFSPVEKGGPAYDVSYLWFDGGLDAALDSMGATGAQLEQVKVSGADAARLVVTPKKSVVLVTGFVQTQGLVQSVNAAQIAPYDEQALAASTKRLLAALARAAPDTMTP